MPPRDPGDTFAALSDPTRRRVLELLARRPHRPGELVAALGLRAPAVSRHLRVLREVGLVEDSLDAEDHRVRVYRLRAEPLRDATRWLAHVEAFWEDQLAAFRDHVAARSRSGR